MLGLTEKDLYFNSFDQFVSQNNDIKSLDKEVQIYKYNKYEENRKKFIEEALKKRKELKKKQIKDLKKSYSSSYILTQGEKLLRNEKIRLNFYKKQQIGELLNIIDREYKKDELKKKLEYQDSMAALREEEIKKMREKERIENEKKEKIRILKMEKRAKNLKDELIRKEKERQEEERKIMIRNEMRKKEEEKERKEKQFEQRLKEEIFQRRLDNLNKLQIKRKEKMEKQLLLKDEIQKKNLEEIRNKKDKQIKARVRSTDEKIQKCYEIIKLKSEQKNQKNKSYFLKKNKSIEDKLNLQKELEKKEMHQKLIQSAIKREDIEDNLRKKERILERNRLKLLNEIEEKDKRINLVKSQKMKIWNEQKQLSKNYEENREKLLKKFELIMSQRKKKSKGEIIKEIFDDTNDLKMIERNYVNMNIPSVNKSANFYNNNNKNQEEVFLTNLSMAKMEEYKYK